MPSGRQFVNYLWAPALAAGVFWLAYDQGSYTLTSRNSIAVVVLWLIALPQLLRFIAGWQTTLNGAPVLLWLRGVVAARGRGAPRNEEGTPSPP